MCFLIVLNRWSVPHTFVYKDHPGFLLVLQGPMENRFPTVCYLAGEGRFNLILFGYTPNRPQLNPIDV